jgi:hypothetical protein
MAPLRYWVSKELVMVIEIDAIRYGAGFDAAGHWHMPKADFVADEEKEKAAEVIAPARGAMCGFLVSAVMWVGLIAAVRAVLTMVR